MYSYLRGILITAHMEYVVLEVHGIGFCIHIAPNHYAKLPAEQSELCLHTSLVIREFSHTLYGFNHAHTKNLFEKLLDISGVGPKLALNIIGHLSHQQLESAYLKKDISLLCTVPGIGKKTAERLIIELKAVLAGCSAPIAQKEASHLQDAISALINLGYPAQDAHSAVSKTNELFPTLSDVGLIISKSLQQM